MDLGAADPTYMLPGLVTLAFLAVTEVGMDGMKMEGSPQMKLVFRVMPVIFLPVTVSMPTGCLLYWFTSNSFAVVQTLVIRSKRVKKALNIPDIPAKVSAFEREGVLEVAQCLHPQPPLFGDDRYKRTRVRTLLKSSWSNSTSGSNLKPLRTLRSFMARGPLLPLVLVL